MPIKFVLRNFSSRFSPGLGCHDLLRCEYSRRANLKKHVSCYYSVPNVSCTSNITYPIVVTHAYYIESNPDVVETKTQNLSFILQFLHKYHQGHQYPCLRGRHYRDGISTSSWQTKNQNILGLVVYIRPCNVRPTGNIHSTSIVGYTYASNGTLLTCLLPAFPLYHFITETIYLPIILTSIP